MRGRTKLRFVSIDGLKFIVQVIFHGLIFLSKFLPLLDKRGSRSKVSFVHLIRLKNKQGVWNLNIDLSTNYLNEQIELVSKTFFGVCWSLYCLCIAPVLKTWLENFLAEKHLDFNPIYVYWSLMRGMSRIRILKLFLSRTLFCLDYFVF